jgi:hypothetical protein
MLTGKQPIFAQKNRPENQANRDLVQVSHNSHTVTIDSLTGPIRFFVFSEVVL